MNVVGNIKNQRRRVTVKTSSSATNQSVTSDTQLSIPTACYIAEICRELALMAKGENLGFLSHILAMAQAEAEYTANELRSVTKPSPPHVAEPSRHSQCTAGLY